MQNRPLIDIELYDNYRLCLRWIESRKEIFVEVCRPAPRQSGASAWVAGATLAGVALQEFIDAVAALRERPLEPAA